jgi:uncharacterized protein YjbI with pentapeptide repeats
MANQEHVDRLKAGVEAWNQWRQEQPEIEPDLSGANLSYADLAGANLSYATLYSATLQYADFAGNLSYANLSYADFTGANLTLADLIGTDLYHTNLSSANLSYADLSNAQGLTESQLSKAFLCRTTLPPEFQTLSNRDCEMLKKREEERRRSPTP